MKTLLDAKIANSGEKLQYLDYTNLESIEETTLGDNIYFDMLQNEDENEDF